MKKETKANIMDKAANDIDYAKDYMERAVETLEENGMYRDAEQLQRMIYRLEAFENKYNDMSLWRR